jgi:hypothetical protein
MSSDITVTSAEANDEPFDERRTSSTLCDGADIEERVSRTRELLVKRFDSTEDNDDVLHRDHPTTHGRGDDLFTNLDIAIKTIEAILVTNDEIFHRCQQLLLNENEHYAENQLFAKYAFKEVKVWAFAPNITQVVVFTDREEALFYLRPLLNLPEGLNMFQPQREKSGFINFRALLQMSLMLHDDMILPFLSKLKHHLESVQVCLGNIDSWLMETAHSIEYLETKFGAKVDPKLKKTYARPRWCKCADNTHTDICANCTKSFSAGQEHCIHRNNFCTFFCGRMYQNLADYTMRGRFEATFDISIEREREQLDRLHDFLSKGAEDVKGYVNFCDF